MQRIQHVTEYAVVTESTAEALSAHMMRAIHEGWQPWGSVTVGPAPDGDGMVYAQPVVRYAEWA